MQGISVIIPCYNDGRFITETVESVFSQNLKCPLEVIVVDDGSTDLETAKILRQIDSRFANLRILHNETNLGVSATLNAGLYNAKYPYILPLGADDKLSADPAVLKNGNFPERALEILENNPNVIFAYSGIRVFEAVNHIWHRPPYDEKWLLTHCNVGPFIVFRKGEAESIGGYNSSLRYGEDMDLNIALITSRLKQGRPADVTYFPEPYILYRRRRDHTNLTSSVVISKRDMLEKIVARNPEIYAKHFPYLEGDKLLNHLMLARRRNQARQVSDLFQRCAFHPYQSFEDGTFAFTLYSARQKLRIIWEKVKGHTLSVTVPAEAPTHRPALTHE